MSVHVLATGGGALKAGSGRFAGDATLHFVSEIEVRLREAHLMASNAKSFSTKGLQERAVETLLNVKILIYEAKALLKTLTIIRRSRD